MSSAGPPYRIVLADPPWWFNDRKCGNTRFGLGSVGNYGCLPTDVICQHPVREWVDRDAALFLWSTWAHLPDALQVMEAWGFRYRTIAFNWVKTNPKSGTPFFGPGYYTKAGSEPCLLGVRGRMKPISNAIHSTLLSPVRKHLHSSKPPEVRERIVGLFGDLPRIELFARERCEGWDAWGNGVDPSHVLEEEEWIDL